MWEFGTFAFPALLIVFAFIRSLPLALIMLAVVGAALILTMNRANALVQTLTLDALRGRVMSIYSLTFFGSMPIGALWVGAVGERVGEPSAVVLSAAIALGCAALIWVFVPKLRALE